MTARTSKRQAGGGRVSPPLRGRFGSTAALQIYLVEIINTPVKAAVRLIHRRSRRQYDLTGASGRRGSGRVYGVYERVSRYPVRDNAGSAEF